MEKWNVEELGYTPKTTFWEDFCIAESFGTTAIVDTFNRAFNEWKDNIEYITELCMVLNHKVWSWYERLEDVAVVYNELWEKLDNYIVSHFEGDDLSYFLSVTD